MNTICLSIENVEKISNLNFRTILERILFPNVMKQSMLQMSYGNYNDYGNYDDVSYANYNDYGNYSDLDITYGNYNDYGNYGDTSYGNYNDYSNYNDD